MPQVRPGRPEAAATIWAWDGLVRETQPRASAGRARLRGVLQALVGAAVGAAIFWFLSRTAGTVVLAIAGVIALSALLSPLGLFAAIERVFASLGTLVGRGLTWILLPAIFYGFFVPFGALFRRGRRDSMKRFFDADAASYWSVREVPQGAKTADERARRYRL